MKNYKSFKKLYEIESIEIPIDVTHSHINKDPKKAKEEYEKILGREGKLSEYLKKNNEKFTFGILKSIFEDAINYKKNRELKKGAYKFLHRAVPMALSFFFFPAWLIGQILGASRAFDKIIVPLLNNPEYKYNDFLMKFIKGTIALSEGEIKYIMKDDWFYNIFAIKDGTLKMIRKEYVIEFATDLSQHMTKESDDKEVPKNYIENHLKTWLNDKFEINPKMLLK
jgi:hypothetical protein